MVTRAVIKFGKHFIATHYDGYPDDLGDSLKHLDVKNLSNIINVAKKHIVDASTPEIKRNFKDSNPVDFKDYGDFAEYFYDIKGKKVLYTTLRGEWHGVPSKAKLKEVV